MSSLTPGTDRHSDAAAHTDWRALVVVWSIFLAIPVVCGLIGLAVSYA